MSRTIVTPGGDVVEVIRDEDYQDLVGGPAGRPAVAANWVSRRPIYGALWSHGPYTDSGGGATRLLYEDAVKLGYEADVTAVSALFRSAAHTVCIARVLRGKRCLDIRLAALPQTFIDKLEAEFPYPAPVAAVEAVPEEEPQQEEEEEPEEEYQQAARAGQPHLRLMAPHPAGAGLDEELPPEDTWQPRPLELNVTNLVAMQLLDQVVNIIATGSAPTHQDIQRLKKLEGDLREVEHRLADRLQENQSLRRKVDLLGDELKARKVEVDGLRMRLRVAEHNLQIAGSADTNRLVTQQVQAELARIMRARPGPTRELASDRG